jgi:hypothetical protein
MVGRLTGLVRWLLVAGVLVGCAGPLEPGRLPTDEERCSIQRGTFRGGICHTCC